MGDLAIGNAKPEQGIGRGHHHPTGSGRHRCHPGNPCPPPPTNLSGGRIQGLHFASLSLSDQDILDQRQGRSDRTDRATPDMLASFPPERGHSPFRAGCCGEHGISRDQYPSRHDARKPRRPDHIAIAKVHRIDLSIHTAAVNRVLFKHDGGGESSAYFGRPHLRGSVPRGVGGDRYRRRSEIQAARVDASHEQG
jgi:hypothetical protein